MMATALKSAVLDTPLPCIPVTPPESVPALARGMVMQGGQWFIPDRVRTYRLHLNFGLSWRGGCQ